MNTDEKKRFREAVNHRLSGLREDPWLAQRILAKQKGEKNIMKRKLSFGLIAALITALALFSVALAAGIIGNVNWLGEMVREDRAQAPLLTPSPAPSASREQTDRELSVITHEILESRADKELVVVQVSDENGVRSGTYSKRTQKIDSLEDFNALLAQADFLPTPNSIPDGYAFSAGKALFACQSGGAFILTDREETQEGLTVERYRVEAQYDYVCGYEFILRKQGDENAYISVYAALNNASDPSEHSFGVNEDQTASVVEVQGMDNALGIVSDHGSSLNLRRVLAEPKAYLAFASDNRTSVDTYGEVIVSVYASNADMDTMIRMFEE